MGLFNTFATITCKASEIGSTNSAEVAPGIVACLFSLREDLWQGCNLSDISVKSLLREWINLTCVFQ